MKYTENTYISAYNKLDKIVEGRVFTSKSGTQLVLTENGRKYPVTCLKAIRLVEDDEEASEAVIAQVKTDVDACKDENLETATRDQLEDIGEKREKELKDKAGMDIKDNEYKNAFVNTAEAEGAMQNAKAGNASESEALTPLTESEDTTDDDISNPADCVNIQNDFFDNTPVIDNSDEEYAEDSISEDYQDVPPFDDSMLYDQANYVLDEYIANTKIFDENELFEKMCESFGVKAEKKENILDSIKEVINVYKKTR